MTQIALKADVELIRTARIAQTQAIARNDWDAVVSYWTPDITVRRALGHAVSGIEGARRALEPTEDAGRQFIYQRKAALIEVSPHWPLAHEEGHWSGHLDSVESEPVIGGRYSAQWVKRDGKWLIRAEVFVALTCSGVGCEAHALP